MVLTKRRFALRLLVGVIRAMTSRPPDRLPVEPFFMIPARDAVYCANCKRLSRSTKQCRGCESNALYPVTKFIPELGDEARLVSSSDVHSGC